MSNFMRTAAVFLRQSTVARQNFLYSPRCFSSKPEIINESSKNEDSSSANINEVMRGPSYQPTDFDKKILIFVKRFKTKEEIPKTISPALMDKARNKARIKISNYMMAATVVGCLVIAIAGRKAAERGESVHKMNLDWHKETNK